MSDLKTEAQRVVSALMKGNPEDGKIVAAYIKSLLSGNVVALGEHEAFALKDDQGRIVATRTTVNLCAEDGTLTQPVWSGPFVISHPGYVKLAAAAGAVVMNANTVIVDGQVQQNPYIRRNERGQIIEVYCRAMAFRYNESGQPQVSDRTTIFDLATYAMADMVGKAKKNPQAFCLLPAGFQPTEKGSWAEYKVDSSVSLWLNVGHEEARTFLGQVINRQKKAIEFAQTFAQRNALKHLFGLAAVPGQGLGRDCKPIPFWSIPVTCWRPMDGGVMRFDSAKYEKATLVLEAVAAGKAAPALSSGEAPITLQVPNMGRVTVDVGVDHVDGESAEAVTGDAEDMHGALPYDGVTGEVVYDAEPMPESEPEPMQEAPIQPSETPIQVDAETQKAWANLQAARDSFGDEFVEACGNLGIASQDVTPANAARIVAEISRIMDEVAGGEA